MLRKKRDCSSTRDFDRGVFTVAASAWSGERPIVYPIGEYIPYRRIEGKAPYILDETGYLPDLEGKTPFLRRNFAKNRNR